VPNGYRALLARMPALRAGGVPVLDATGLFDQRGDEIYSDDVARLSIGSQEVIDKKSSGLATRAGACKLPPNQPVPITVEYTHSSTGPASMHLYWLSTSARGNIIQIVP